jgi:hypothetical protein
MLDFLMSSSTYQIESCNSPHSDVKYLAIMLGGLKSGEDARVSCFAHSRSVQRHPDLNRLNRQCANILTRQCVASLDVRLVSNSSRHQDDGHGRDAPLHDSRLVLAAQEK